MSLIELFEYLEQNKLITLVPLASNTGETSIGREKKANSKRFCRRTISMKLDNKYRNHGNKV